MLSFAVGSLKEIDGKSCILTWEGSSGHAIYGPYQHLAPGHYVVEFNLGAAENRHLESESLCATVDVTADFGRLAFVCEDVTLSRLCNGPISIRLAFYTEAPQVFEFRVAVTGIIPLLIEDYCRVVALEDADADFEALLNATRFPDPGTLPKPPFFLNNVDVLRRLYEKGAVVKVIGDDVVLTMDGVSFYARVIDDLRFVDEIFFRSTYNFKLGQDCCVIDIGMNIGLVSLTFALKSEVKEVHSFEPFKGTYDRARANLSLNPTVANKISANNFGLAGVDQNTTVFIYDGSDSGAFSIRGSSSGTPEQISVRNASNVLGPIIASAKSKNRDVIAKIDCEGSEFPIFQALNDDGLLADISAFMVEWHRGVDGKTQQDLIAPLVQQGFVIFDLTGKTGNGFFYAVKGGHSSKGMNYPAGATLPTNAAQAQPEIG